MNEQGLRFAIATDGPFTLWQARCIESLAMVPGVTLAQWFPEPAMMTKNRSATAAALAVVPAPEDLLAIDARRSKPASASAEPIARADVLLDLTRDGARGAPDQATEVWHFAYGSSLSRDPVRSALIDYIRTPGRSYVALVGEPGTRILREGWLSWWRGEELDRLLLDPAGWPAAIAADGMSAIPAVATAVVGAVERRTGGRNRMNGVPRPVLTAAALGRRMVMTRDVLTRHDDWNVGIIDAPIERFLSSDVDEPTVWLPKRREHFAADPFGLERDGQLHIFFEDYDQRRGRGSIAHVAIAANGSTSDVDIVLDPGVHTSYPYLLEHAGELFMVPETAAAGELSLYMAVHFPDRWRRVATLLRGVPAVDATVIQHEGRWWMFATRDDMGANHNLFAWHAPDLTGPWTSHQANPVKTDARSARPGGSPFVVDGQLYRPSQDDSMAYGGRLVLNRVDTLTTRRFAETPVRRILPDAASRYRDGLHTLSAAGSRTLIDGNVRHLVKATLDRNISGRVRRLRRSTKD